MLWTQPSSICLCLYSLGQNSEHSQHYVFLTNNLSLPALTIAQAYKQRWKIELFFKWIKQHLKIKSFLGTSQNAVKTQIWIAISTYVLIAIVKKRLKLEYNLYTFLQILSVTIFEKTEISRLDSDNDNINTFIPDFARTHKLRTKLCGQKSGITPPKQKNLFEIFLGDPSGRFCFAKSGFINSPNQLELFN